MRTPDTNRGAAVDPVALGLAALAWTLGDPARAARLLAITGLEPEDLRARAMDPHVLGAVFAFLEAYQPDLTACAEALEVSPETLVDAHRRLDA